MFNISVMNLGDKITGVIADLGISQADLIRKMHTLSPDVALTTLQGAISRTMKRGSESSKYLPLVAKALNLTVEEILNWSPDSKHKINQESPPNGAAWPFGTSVSPEEYASLSPKQKEVIIARIVSFLDANSNM